MARRPIPAIHCSIVAFGGPEIRLADRFHYGPAGLSSDLVATLEGRNGCPMANRGIVVYGADLTRTMWLAGKLEALAHQHYHALAIGGGHLLCDGQIEETARELAACGVRAREEAR